MLVVERQRPEPVDRRRLILREGDGVAIGAVEPRAAYVEVLIEIFRFIRRIDQNVRLGRRCAREIVGAECGSVRDRG